VPTGAPSLRVLCARVGFHGTVLLGTLARSALRRLRFFRLQIAEQALKTFRVGVVFLPVAEIGNEIFANLARQVLPFVGVEKLPVPNRLKRNQSDGKQHALFLRTLPLPGFADFSLYPRALHAVRRKDQEQPLISSDRFVDLLMDFLSSLYIVRREPAADAFVLQIRVQAVGEFLIFGGIADEAGIELNGIRSQRLHVGNEVVRDTTTAQERLRDVAIGLKNRVDAYYRGTNVVYCFQSLNGPEVIGGWPRLLISFV